MGVSRSKGPRANKREFLPWSRRNSMRFELSDTGVCALERAVETVGLSLFIAAVSCLEQRNVL